MWRVAWLLVLSVALVADAGPDESGVGHYLPFPAGTSYQVSQGIDQAPTHNDESRALQPLLKYRRVVAAALKQQAKAEATLAKVKPGKKPPSRPYRHAIAAFGRALAIAPGEYTRAVDEHIEALPRD